jgi:NAD(P)-dependent dehydrogenase (short-subunit alcohol dehydrogenase family)
LPGIGRYTALALANYGVKRLALADINLEAMRTTADEIQKRHSDLEIKVLELDVSKETSIEQAIDETVAQFGRIDFAINNAGIAGPSKPTTDVGIGDWQKLLDVNLTGVWLCQRAEIRQMLKQDVVESE